MELSLVVDWSREAVRLSLLLGGPLLAVALVVGLVVGVAQTLTQLHEPVVALVPRLIAVAVALLVLLPWLVGRWVAFAGPLFEAVPAIVGGK
jgi:flagellar biosynthesis protein FliQ